MPWQRRVVSGAATARRSNGGGVRQHYSKQNLILFIDRLEKMRRPAGYTQISASHQHPARRSVHPARPVYAALGLALLTRA